MEPRDHASGSISPELVLVDPVLAAGARAALPDRPWPAPAPIELPPRRVRRRRIPLAAILGTVSLAAVLAILGYSMFPMGDRPTLASEGDQLSAARTPSTRAARPQIGGVKGARQKIEPEHGPPARSKPATPRQTVTQARTPRTTRKTRRAAVAQFTPARLFSWPPRAGAVSYRVAFMRDGRTLYRTETRTPWLRLPRSVRFSPGRYQWTVWPATRDGAVVRLGAPIVDSTFRVGRD